MQITLSRSLDWRWLARTLAPFALVAFLAANLLYSLPNIAGMVHGGMDWDILTAAGDRIAAGQNPYAGEDYGFRYSPLVAWFFALIEPIGWWGWVAAGFAVLLPLRDWRLIGLCLCLFPVWTDLSTGMSLLYVPVLTLLALRGSYWGGLALVATSVLVPRPMVIPILAYLLWKRRELWLPSAAIAVVLTLGAVATGWMPAWIAEVVAIGSREENYAFQPAATLGPLWVLALPLAAWLTVKGRLGLAALAISPYWTWSYFQTLLLEAPDRHRVT